MADHGVFVSVPTSLHAAPASGDVDPAFVLCPATWSSPAESDIVLSETTPSLPVSSRETCFLSEAAQARQRSAHDRGESGQRSNLRGISRALPTSAGVGTLSGVCDNVFITALWSGVRGVRIFFTHRFT